MPMPCVWPILSYKCRWSTPPPSMGGLPAGANTPRKSWFMGTTQRAPAMFAGLFLPILEFAQLQAAILGAHISPLASHHIFSVRKQFESWTNKHQIAGSGPAHVILGWRSKGARQGDGRSPPSKPKRYKKNACRVASWDVRPLYTLCEGLAVRETVENNDMTCPCKPQGLWLERNSLAPRIPTGHFCSQDSVSCHCLDKTHDQRHKLFVVLSTDWVRYEFRYWLIQ